MTQDVSKRNFHQFNEYQELFINKALRPLNSLGSDYFYYLVKDNEQPNKSYRFCTHENWMDFYYDEKLIENDPLKRIIENSNNAILPWSQASFTNQYEKRTMSGRNSFGLYNGISIVNQYNNKSHIFVMATESSEHDLARYLILEKSQELKKLMRSCMGHFDDRLQKIAA